MGRSRLLVSGLKTVSARAALCLAIACLAIASPDIARAQSAPVPLNSPPALNLQQMMEALRQQNTAAPATNPAGTGQGLNRPAVVSPNRPQAPTLPSTLSPPAEQAAPAQTVQDQKPDLPDSLMPFEEPSKVESDAEAAADNKPPMALGLDKSIADHAEKLGMTPEALTRDLDALSQVFAGDLGMNATAPALQAQALAVSFIDYLYRRDQPRIRALVGLPFYADDFMVDNDRDLTKLLGPSSPITGPPAPVVEERRDDRLIGITTMRIAELRESDFYIGDRGADLLGLDEEDFYVHLVFLRGERIKPMIVYVRRASEDRFEIAGFFD